MEEGVIRVGLQGLKIGRDGVFELLLVVEDVAEIVSIR
jgi:hypothetical protein